MIHNNVCTIFRMFIWSSIIILECNVEVLDYDGIEQLADYDFLTKKYINHASFVLYWSTNFFFMQSGMFVIYKEGLIFYMRYMFYTKDYLIQFVNQNFSNKTKKVCFGWLLLQNNSLKVCVNKKQKQLTRK